MSSHIQSTIDPNDGFCTMSNGGATRYCISVLSTLDYVAVRGDSNRISIYSTFAAKKRVTVPASTSIKLWACAGIKDPTPVGKICYLDVANNCLIELDLNKCHSLVSLNCQRNQLRSLDLTSCQNLENVDCSQNQLGELKLTRLTRLRDLNCSSNLLKAIDLSTCRELAIVDGKLNCHGNPLSNVNITASQLKSGILSGQLGSNGTVNIICGRSFRAVARNLAKEQFPAAWKIELS